MKTPKMKSAKRIGPPRKNAGFEELSAFFDRHDVPELLEQVLVEEDPTARTSIAC
jgi:hypothetical protein